MCWLDLFPSMFRIGDSMLLSGRIWCVVAAMMIGMFPIQIAMAQEGSSHPGQETPAAADHDASHPTTVATEAANGAQHAGADHGAGHADPPGTPPLLQIDIGSAICNLAIFLGVLAILSKFVWPAILGGLQAREQKINGDLEAAEKANRDAKSLLNSYQAKLDDAASQVQSMLASARKDAEASGQRIVDAAKQEADRQRERAIGEIETAKKVALSEIAGQTSDMAIQVAKQVVGRELRADDHADLIRQALKRLPSNN
jgi:F-type H+-transporting ATPase subunit b